MPRFSQDSLSKLNTCHRELQVLFFEVIKHFDCTIIAGFRNEEDQEKAFRNGKTQIHWPNGNHNKSPAMAIDVSPFPIDWNNSGRFYWFAGYVMGIAQKLKDEGKMTMSVRYGGDWNRDYEIKDNKFNDLVHFEIIN